MFCEFDGDIKIVEVQDSSRVISLMDNAEEYESISCFCLHPNGFELVVATSKFTLRHWIWKEKKCTKNIKAHRMPILCMEYDPTGTLIATGSADRIVRVWNILKGYCTHSFTGHSDIVRTVMFHPHASQLHLFSTSDDSSIHCYDLKKQACIAIWKEHVALPTQLAISGDGQFLASAGRDKVGPAAVCTVHRCIHDIWIESI
jgi:U3 small nucleolar RNA-associated protein 13